MTLPNILTISRIILAVVIVGLLMSNSLMGNIAATLFFAIAALTDFYDGYIAKKYGLVGDFGKIMDPIADKILMIAVFGVLAYLGMIAWWMVIVIAVREIAVTASRLAAMRQGQILPAETAGKIKTAFQMGSVFVILIFLMAEQSAGARNWFYVIENNWRTLIDVLMVINMVLTVGSGAAYFWKKFNDESNS